jgi:AbrB family looped-hinge helix DNA binding protein
MVGSRLTTKGQTTIPKEIRDHLGLEPGDRVLFLLKDGSVVVHPVKLSLLDLRGSVEPRQSPEDFDAVREQVRQKVARRRAGG